ASPPVLSDPSGNRVMTGTVAGNFALFCIGSWVADGGGHVVIVGNRPVAIIADSLMRLTNGSWVIAGSYAIDDNGAPGVGGGTNGGSAGNAGAGPNGGHPGVGWASELDSVTFDASGGGGAGGLAAGSAGGFAGGGGGGGGGGVLTLEAPTVSFNNGCLSVIGGPGGAGGALTRGGDAKATTMC